MEDVVADDARTDRTGRSGQHEDNDLAQDTGRPPQAVSVVPHTAVHEMLRGLLEHVQDVIVLGLCVVLFLIMVRALWDLGQGALSPQVDVRSLLSQVLFVTLLIELYRLVVVYLHQHRVAVDFVVEIAMVGALREVVLRGVTNLPWDRLLAITAFVLALGAVLRFAALRSPGGNAVEQQRPARRWWSAHH